MRGRCSLADRFCEAIKELTAERQTRTYAALFVPSVRERAAYATVKADAAGIA
jgi:hypothetical protein